jgi:hypothetical protein
MEAFLCAHFNSFFFHCCCRSNIFYIGANMILTAKEMHNSPAQAYREADKGETVVINHDRYPDKVFELTARDRKPLQEKKECSSQE